MLTAEKIDFDLLHAIFMRFPNYQFIFVGSTNQPSLLGRLKNYPNFHHIPEGQDEVLAAILHQLDLAIVPELENYHSRDSDENRLFYYHTCGVPILSTTLPKSGKLAECVNVASSVWEFSYLLERLISNPPPREASAPTSSGKAATRWDVMTETLLSLFTKAGNITSSQ